MKNILLASNIILLALVGYLYYLHFSSDKKTAVRTSHVTDSTVQAKVRVAYIDLDSLQNNYDLYKKIKAESDQKQQTAANEITAMQARYQTRAVELQKKGATMTQQEQSEAMKEINQMQQNLQDKKQKWDNELYDYNSKMKEDILKRLQDFLKEYNQDSKYDYILSYEPAFMFYKDSTLNITKDVIVGLNERYSNEKK